jgi:hypothetical protein
MTNILVTGGAGFTLFLFSPFNATWVEPVAPHKSPNQGLEVFS